MGIADMLINALELAKMGKIKFYGDAGASVAYDITGINSLRSDLVERAVLDPKKVVQIAHDKKERSVGAQLRAEGISFHPISFTSLGLWHKVAVTEISKLVKSKCLRLGLISLQGLQIGESREQ